MSFIYAEKYSVDESRRKSIRVLCDTKVTPNNYSAANFSNVSYDLIMNHGYGIIKSTIICPEICVSFAGNNTVFAAKLFCQLKELGVFDPEYVSELAFSIHKNAPSCNDIEFIITYISNDQVFIDCVKNGKLERNVENAHIGSVTAFREFQHIRLASQKPVAERTKGAFLEVVDEGIDDTVGGFVFEVVFDYEISSFVYNRERAFHTSKPQIVELGQNINFHMSAADGGYSYEIIPRDIENVLINIDQMRSAVLYSRRFRVDDADTKNKNLLGLMMPILVEIKDNGEIVRCK